MRKHIIVSPSFRTASSELESLCFIFGLDKNQINKRNDHWSFTIKDEIYIAMPIDDVKQYVSSNESRIDYALHYIPANKTDSLQDRIEALERAVFNSLK
jgi:hypothetical protein